MSRPKITVCIPHWQVYSYITVCLRSIRKHSQKYDLEVIVVDNGSRDESLDYLRSLDWIRLIERPEEVHTNWPLNVFTAWDRGLQEATGDYYLGMHSDVFVKVTTGSIRCCGRFKKVNPSPPRVPGNWSWNTRFTSFKNE